MGMKQVKSFGPAGVAKITKTVKGRWIVVLEDSGERFEVLFADAPDYLSEPGRYSVMLSQDGLRIVSAKPLGGTHFAEFVGFKRKDDKTPPIPDKNPGGLNFFGKFEDPFLEFTAQFKIVEGTYKGFPISWKLRYVFTPSPDKTETYYGGPGQKKVEEFLNVMGYNMVTDTLPWSENVLPDLEKMLLKNKVGAVMMELNDKGFPIHVAPLPAGMVIKAAPKAAAVKKTK